MATTTKFSPFEVEHIEQIGEVLRINAVNARLPAAVLPDRARLTSTWRKRAGTTWRQFGLRHRCGIVTFPDAPGDGEPSCRQVLDWLDRQGYRQITADDPDAEFVRQA